MEKPTKSQEKAYKLALNYEEEMIFFIRSSEFEKCPSYYDEELFKPHRVIVIPDAHIEDTTVDFYVTSTKQFNNMMEPNTNHVWNY